MLKKLLKKEMKSNSESLVIIGNKKYAFDLSKIKDFCLMSDKEKGGEVEIMEVHEPNERGNLTLSSKTVHEVKGTGNPQNDTIMYDLIKVFIVTLLNSEIDVNSPEKTVISHMDFATRLAFNTLIEMGFLYEIKEN